MNLKRVLLVGILLACVAWFVSSIAQEVDPSPSIPLPQGAREVEIGVGNIYSDPPQNGAAPSAANPVGVSAIVAMLVPMLIAGIKSRVPTQYRKWLPLLAPLLGEIIMQAISHLFAAMPSGLGAVSGSAGVGLREIKDQHVPAKAKAIAIIGLVGTLALPLVGCASLEKAALRPEITIVTNTVERLVVQTNTIPIAVAVPGQTVIQTNFVERVVTNEVQVMQTQMVTNYVVKPEIADGLQVARVGAAVATTVNPAAGGAATIALGILGAGLGWLAARKNKQAGQSQKQLTAVIKGVEDFTTGFDDAGGAKVKDAIAAASKELGVADSLHATVQELTETKI